MVMPDWMPDYFEAYLIVVASWFAGAAIAQGVYRVWKRRKTEAQFAEFRLTPEQLERLRRRLGA